MKALIDFIYTGSITIDDQNNENLQLGAEYLKLDKIKQFCDEFLQEKSKLFASFPSFLFKAAAILNKKNTLEDYSSEHVSTT